MERTHALPQVFKKQVDKLQTDHQGTFVLKDNDFRWTSRYAEGERDRWPIYFADNPFAVGVGGMGGQGCSALVLSPS